MNCQKTKWDQARFSSLVYMFGKGLAFLVMTGTSRLPQQMLARHTFRRHRADIWAPGQGRPTV